MITICASMQPMEFRILTKSAFPDLRSITKMSQWRSNVDIDQVSFPSVDITSKGLVQKFYIHQVCTDATKVGKLQIQQRAQPKLAANQSQSLFRYIPRRFIFLQKTYFYSWFILQITFDKFLLAKEVETAKWRQRAQRQQNRNVFG